MTKTVMFYRDCAATNSMLQVAVDNQEVLKIKVTDFVTLASTDVKKLKVVILNATKSTNQSDKIVNRVLREKLDLKINWYWGDKDTPFITLKENNNEKVS